MHHRISSRSITGAAFVLAGASLSAQGRVPTTFEQVGSFGTSLVRESSGIAVSRRHPGVLWTHNDSGDGPNLYAVRLDGTVLGRHAVTGARAVDWEDLALAPCPTVRGDCLYVADTGDNEALRRSVTVYILPEPDPTEGRAAGRTRLARAVHVTYPDGPHDVEAMWVDPDGSVELVTKGQVGEVHRYRVARESLLQDSARAEARGDVPISPQRAIGRWVTGAAIAPHGRRVAIRTYTEIFFFQLTEKRALVPDGPACWLGTREAQGEAVAFLDDDTLVLTSEGLLGQHGLIHRVRC